VIWSFLFEAGMSRVRRNQEVGYLEIGEGAGREGRTG